MDPARVPEARLLLIEDDDVVREGTATALEGLGYEVRAESDGTQLEAHLDEFEPDLAVLDVSLPVGPDGFEMATRIRNRNTTPVIFVTAADSLDDRIRGFDAGADDYLIKPFSTRELAVRVRAVMQRSKPAAASVLQVHDVRIDLVQHVVERGGEPVSLTPTEFDLLVVLARNAGRACSKRELLDAVWHTRNHAPHLVEVQISGLRRKLDALGPRIVMTTRTGSYVIEP